MDPDLGSCPHDASSPLLPMKPLLAPLAVLSPVALGALLRELSDRHPTAIVSGRSMEKLRAWVEVAGLYFAGSHGFEIAGDCPPHQPQRTTM